MKSALSRSAVGRRVIPGTVLALAAATFSLAGPASAAQPIELQGTVTGAGGVALENVDVRAYDATSGNFIETVQTNAQGHYEFTDDLVVGKVKLAFDPDSFPSTANAAAFPVTATSPLPYQTRWSGGSRYKAGATVTTTSVDPATAPVVSASLPQYASVGGNIRVGADGHVANVNFGAFASNADEDGIGYVELGGPEYVDGVTGNYRMIVDPATPVRVGAFGSDTGVSFLTQYWQDADTLATATPIAIASGQNVTGINFRLTNVLRARQAPSIAGYPTVGLPLTASPGSWVRNAGTEFSYAWLRNGVPVGTGATYVPTAADFGQKLTVVVTALNGEFTGQSSTVTSDAVKWGATEKAGAKALKGRKVAVHVKLVSAHQKPVKGKVVIMRGTKVVHKAVKLVKGKLFLVLKNQPKGHQTYTVHFKGNKKIAQVDKTFTVRVHK